VPAAQRRLGVALEIEPCVEFVAGHGTQQFARFDQGLGGQLRLPLRQLQRRVDAILALRGQRLSASL